MMNYALKLLRENRTEELWQRCCGFIDLNIDEFMNIQHQLLLEQIELLNNCELGHRIMQGAKPRDVAQFRQQVPLTAYRDYLPYLSEKIESALPEKPVLWQRTSGRSSEFSCKWVPITARMYQELGNIMLAVFIFGSCKERGDISLKEHDKILYGLAPPPYASGSWMRRLDEEKILDFLPPITQAEQMEFKERIEAGFKLALMEGLDVMGAIASVLIGIGERFGEGGGSKRIGTILKQPRQLPRLLKAVLRAKLARRALLPRDVWTLKSLVCSGTDAYVYRERLKEMWGKYPLDVYGSTECQIIATQTWDFSTLTFIPYTNFLEFIPEAEFHKWEQDETYRPRVLLLNEVIPGERYSIVTTNLSGGAYTRYVLGDIIEIMSLQNTTLGINLPQMSFYSRAGDIIDFAAFTHAFFTEKIIFSAITKSGLNCLDWVARKEVVKDAPILHLYIEPKEASADSTEEPVTNAIHEELKKLNHDYEDLERFFGFKPLKVTMIPRGSFDQYMVRQKEAGADLAHLKPRRMNPTIRVMEALLGEEMAKAAMLAEPSNIQTQRS